MSTRIRTLIVDDEALARRGLELRLASAADFEVVAQCASGREALEAIREHAPDLVFLDVQMPGMSGFDMLAQLPAESTPLVVFVTAFDGHALRAFEAHALDYLLKPVNEARFAAALGRVRDRLQQRRALDQRDRLLGLLAELSGSGELALEELMEKGRDALGRRYPEVIPIRQGRETLRVPMDSIDWVDAAGDYMCLHARGQTHVLRATMKELEALLDPKLFQRVHRSTIVNLRRVQRLRAHLNGEYFLTLESGQELKLSRSYREAVGRLLEIERGD